MRKFEQPWTDIEPEEAIQVLEHWFAFIGIGFDPCCDQYGYTDETFTDQEMRDQYGLSMMAAWHCLGTEELMEHSARIMQRILRGRSE